MTTTENSLKTDVRNGVEYKVADLSLAEFGRKELDLAEYEMPGLMSLRREYAEVQPSRGPNLGLAAHDCADRGADRDLDLTGAEVRWASCNIFSTRTTRPRPSSSARTAPRRHPRAYRCSPGRASRSRSTGGPPSRC